MHKKDELKKAVQEGYSRIVMQNSSCCPGGSCCGPLAEDAKLYSEKIGYGSGDLENIPAEANLGLGCGNPAALGSLNKGDTVLDLGSGAGMDSFLAAGRVGRNGKVIGVDMTPEMIARARENAEKNGYENVEFRLGEIESLPLPDASVDVILSNCVINLSPEKEKVFREAFRVLKPGGRLMVSDLVLLKDLPEKVKASMEAYVGCIAGAEKKEDYLEFVKTAGFDRVDVVGETSFFNGLQLDDDMIREIVGELNISPEEEKEAAEAVVSLKFTAQKPGF